MKSADVEKLINQVLTKQTMDESALQEFIKAVAQRNIEISLVEKWLKAVHSNGISVPETTQLTKGMMLSGSVIDWQDNSLVVDKHSTGGVGDKMSLMLAPILAACGLKVPMLAGRGLGHTGGTIDKLESIPGFNCSLNPLQMQDQVELIGCCIAAQNDAIAPADGLLYAIRDVTDTIDSIPLITASIISKKAAEGLGSLVLDVKCGKAAFMQTLNDATALAKSMVGAANGLGINTVAQITQMDYPIGQYVGNSLEVLGSILVLQGKGSKDTLDIVVLQCAELMVRAGIANSHDQAEDLIAEVIANGSALEKFRQMCIQQGVDEVTAQTLIDNPNSVLPSSEHITEVTATKSGYVSEIDSMVLADIARKHGAGRFTIEDEIISEIGFEICFERGQYVEAGSNWLKFHHNQVLSEEEIAALSNSLTTSPQKIQVKSRLISIIE
jgi:thymidine phosphorylase